MSPGEDGGAINQRAAEREKMPEHEPAPFPPRHRAEDAAVVIHRGRHVRRGEREINRGRHEQHVSQTQPKHAQSGDEKPDASPPAAQLTGARPMDRFGIGVGHQAHKPGLMKQRRCPRTRRLFDASAPKGGPPVEACSRRCRDFWDGLPSTIRLLYRKSLSCRCGER